MRGIASRFVVSSLLPGESKLGEPSKTTLFSLASVWILASWDCRRLHTSNTPIPSAIRTTSTTSTLTRTYRCHPCTLTLVIARNCNGKLRWDDPLQWERAQTLARSRPRNLDNKGMSHQWAEWEQQLERLLGVLAQPAQGHSAQHMLQNMTYDLKIHWCIQAWIWLDQSRKDDVSLSSIRKFRANHLGSNLRPGAEA